MEAQNAKKEPYEKPQIIRHEAHLSNHFGRGAARRVMDRIDGIPVADLIREYGSPLFVFSEKELRAKAEEMREAFTSRWPRVCLAWSYKTNDIDAVCGLFHQEGWAAEVVSMAEYQMARRLGVPGQAIIFNGACKPERALRVAMEEGALIQVDHFDELDLIERIAAERGVRQPIALRVNMVVEALGISWDRFGFNLENGEVQDAARRIAGSPWLELVGLHCHLGTYIPHPEAYRESARRLSALAREIEKFIGCTIRTINLGGGLPSKSALHTQYGQPDDTGPTIAAFADAITSELRKFFGERREPPTLIMECGRALCDESGTLLTTVMGSRRLPSGGRGIILDAGVNLLYTATWYRHDVIPTREVGGLLEDTTLYGPLCMAIDVVRRSVLLPPVGAGDVIALRPVGAYNVTQWMQFSQMRPALVMLNVDGTVEVIRRAETIEDLKAVERLSDRYRVQAPRELPVPLEGNKTPTAPRHRTAIGSAVRRR